ncbi:MAG TPA: PilC/PilY family type IV pilus protein [Thermoanaerobaculia bacterium]
MSPREWCTGWSRVVSCIVIRAAAAFVLLALAAAAARGDDRDLLRSSVADPYLFIILDTSGSMNWSPKTATCTTGDCFVPLQADDPSSKAYQARQALYQVLTDSSLEKINLGFATYNQDQLSATAKHWLYQAQGDGVLLTPGTARYPAAGAQEVFGNLWGCDTGNNDNEIGCYSTKPARLTDTWETTRVQRLPKGGLSYSQSVTFFISSANVTYKVTYAPAGGSYGSNITIKVTVLKCNNSACSNTTSLGFQNVTFAPISDFLSWDNGDPNAQTHTNPQLSYYTSVAIDTVANNTCSGWDPNTDTLTGDTTAGYDLRFPTDSSDSRGAPFTVGDVIPLDWKTDHKTDVLKRLAPNYVDGNTVPDFRVGHYFKDNRSGSETFLRLKDDNQRPLISSGSTPIGAAFQQFRTWYSGCSADTCPKVGGWAAIAGAQDSSFECRQKYLLILTDGDETCGGNPCKYAQLLESQFGVTVFVVAFGVTATPGNQLSCMVSDPKHLFFPQNQADLVTALQNALGQIKEQATTFASAAVPSVQAEVADRIYLSSFTPLNNASTWDGHLDGYLKPLPLANGKPDRSQACSALGGSTRSSCHLWDAGQVIVGQAPDKSTLGGTLDAGTLRLGLADTQRRVFYAQAVANGTLPAPLRLFAPPGGDPASDPNWTDLFAGLKVTLPATPTATDYANAKTRVNKIIANTLAIKKATVQTPGLPDQDIQYVLGDIFHADPVLVDRPNDFSFYSANLYANPSATDCSTDPGYRCFAQQQTHRRKMLLVGTNDGQLHAIDAGVWDNTAGSFTDGTGEEIFSYMPRLGLPIVRDQAEKGHQIFGVDGTPRVEDVFIDPKHTVGAASSANREWRTVAIGGFREGGGVDGGGRVGDFVSGYYALDVTHPDQLNSSHNPTSQATVPSCLDTANAAVSSCGTLPFPAALWEFTDSIGKSQLDEDRNGYPDLGQTWSVPTLGRIKVVEGGTVVDKFVAIFGGGMDADNKTSPKRGNWLYMVDIETGKTIYKRALVGATPADPAALDVDLDGYIDTIYIGTTSGFLYKVNVSSPGTLQDVTLATNQAVPALAASTTVKRITDSSWDPFPIFDTLGRPIYFAPTLFYVARLSRFALALGTGDRENLWNLDGIQGRFYLFIDDNFTSSMVAGGTLPKTEADYQGVDATASDLPSTSDFVVNPPAGKGRGWYLKLQTDERVITQTFGLSGVIIFSGFQPQDVGVDPSSVCARGGSSHIFVVFANNANSVMQVGGTATRFRVVPKFVTNPYVEQGSTKNPPGSTPNSEQLDVTQQQILAELKKFFPKGTKFANYWISVSGIRSDTGYERYATIPVGIIERNWKEF